MHAKTREGERLRTWKRLQSIGHFEKVEVIKNMIYEASTDEDFAECGKAIREAPESVRRAIRYFLDDQLLNGEDDE
jgi:hypothetical protein